MPRIGAQAARGGIPALHTHGPWAAAVGYLRGLWTAYWERRTRLATMAVLGALDDTTLKDLGLHRSEIGSLVYGTRRDRRI